VTAHAEGTFTGAAGGSVYWQSWQPAETKAVVVLSHGLAEHSGRYAHVAERLADAGYALYAVDHWGHGRSDGTRANLERIAHVTADLDTLLARAREEHPGVPAFILGHSMGGLIALDFLVTRGESGLRGAVLSGSAVDLSAANPVQRRLAGVLSQLLPNLGAATLDSKAVSRDPAVVEDYEQDPLNYHGKVRARTGAEMLLAVDRVVAGLGSLTLPVLVMHGEKDRLVPVAGSRLVAERIGSADKTLTVYDGLYHEIFNEPERDAVLEDVVTWLDKHL
jgi:alpha-beta hydrolase superfamily lysophospholipase